MNKDIYEMKLHEVTFLDVDSADHFVIYRVPGGWIYILKSLSLEKNPSFFVPFDNEFQPVAPR